MTTLNDLPLVTAALQALAPGVKIEPKVRESMKTTVYGTRDKIASFVDRVGGRIVPKTAKTNDGQLITDGIFPMEGGYDDYCGTVLWCEVEHPPMPIRLTRFSPKPGVWMSAIRL